MDILKDLYPDDMSVIMRSHGIMQISTNDLEFKDVMNFIPVMSLEKFGSIFNEGSHKKSLWPYSFFTDIQDIIAKRTFPGITCFDSVRDKSKFFYHFSWAIILLTCINDDWTLRDCFLYMGIPLDNFPNAVLACDELPDKYEDSIMIYLTVDPYDYVQAKIDFDDKIASGEYKSVLSLLQDYNIRDCLLLQQSWTKYIDSFYQYFGVDVQGTVSLSSLAQLILFRNFPEDTLPIVTFNEAYTWLSKDVRSNLYGGLACVFHRIGIRIFYNIANFLQKNFNKKIVDSPIRHAECRMHPEYTHAASFLPNNSRVKIIEVFDFNSLYPSVMKNCLMPCGPGTIYRNVGSDYEIEFLGRVSGNASKISLQWLNEMQNSDMFLHNNRRVYIQCAITGGEKQIGKYFLGSF